MIRHIRILRLTLSPSPSQLCCVLKAPGKANQENSSNQSIATELFLFLRPVRCHDRCCIPHWARGPSSRTRASSRTSSTTGGLQSASSSSSPSCAPQLLSSSRVAQGQPRVYHSSVHPLTPWCSRCQPRVYQRGSSRGPWMRSRGRE